MNCVIFHFIPFDFCTHPIIRTTFDVMTDGVRTMPYESLHQKAIRHLIVEIYTALKDVIVDIIQKNIKDMPIPNVHFTVDKVKSKVSSDNYLGLRIYLLDRTGRYRSINLSIKEYLPSSSLNDIQASLVLKTWLKHSFKEFDLDIDRHIGMFTNFSDKSLFHTPYILVTSFLLLHLLFFSFSSFSTFSSSFSYSFSYSFSSSSSSPSPSSFSFSFFFFFNSSSFFFFFFF